MQSGAMLCSAKKLKSSKKARFDRSGKATMVYCAFIKFFLPLLLIIKICIFFKINLSLILLFSLTFSDESAIKEVSLGVQEKKINQWSIFSLSAMQFAIRIDHTKICLFFTLPKAVHSLSARLLSMLTKLKIVFSLPCQKLSILHQPVCCLY